jgi:hypothetical protein
VASPRDVGATGYTVDYSLLKVDAVDERGLPKHQRGVSAEPGVYFLELPWQSRRSLASLGYGKTLSIWRTGFFKPM